MLTKKKINKKKTKRLVSKPSRSSVFEFNKEVQSQQGNQKSYNIRHLRNWFLKEVEGNQGGASR